MNSENLFFIFFYTNCNKLTKNKLREKMKRRTWTTCLYPRAVSVKHFFEIKNNNTCFDRNMFFFCSLFSLFSHDLHFEEQFFVSEKYKTKIYHSYAVQSIIIQLSIKKGQFHCFFEDPDCKNNHNWKIPRITDQIWRTIGLFGGSMLLNTFSGLFRNMFFVLKHGSSAVK